jgi:purine-binding chemotaxis protein CheW
MAKRNNVGSLQVLTFGLQGEVCAIGADMVREILDLVPVTAVPQSSPFVGGLINVRGKVVPLADLRVKFGMPASPPTVDTRIVVIEVDLAGEPTIVGMLADKVYEVAEIDGASIEETPEIGMKWPAEFIKGIGKRDDQFILFPDIERIFGAV